MQNSVTETNPQASPLAERFMQTLQQIEASGDVEPLVELFAEDAELMRLTHDAPERGKDGARKFWKEYLSNFGVIHSEFHRVLEGSSGIGLEWVSQGTLQGGTPIRYRGISVLETQGERVKKFRTYYDSAVFTPAGMTVKEGQVAPDAQQQSSG